MEINGLPAHAIVIHVAVVFGPLAALLAIAYVVVPRWRDRLRLPMLVLALLAGCAVAAAYLTGDNLLEQRPQLRQLPTVRTHEDRAGVTLWLTIAFAVVAVVAAVLHRRPGLLRAVVGAVLALGAVAVLVSVVLTGEAGAQAVWGS